MIYAIFLLYVLTSAIGMVLIKAGGVQSYINISKDVFTMELNWSFVAGILLYIISFVSWTYILQKFKLSVISPIAYGLVFVVLTLASIVILKEEVKIQTIIGAILIIGGVIITYLGK